LSGPNASVVLASKAASVVLLLVGLRPHFYQSRLPVYSEQAAASRLLAAHVSQQHGDAWVEFGNGAMYPATTKVQQTRHSSQHVRVRQGKHWSQSGFDWQMHLSSSECAQRRKHPSLFAHVEPGMRLNRFERGQNLLVGEASSYRCLVAC
jgi:hypothetical protein